MISIIRVISILTVALFSQSSLAQGVVDPMYTPGIVADVVSEVRSPRAYDWRRNSYELQLGYGYIDEQNNFENEVFELMVGFPGSGGFMPRMGIRRVHMMGTPSSAKLARTPFKQEAGMTRYEVVGGFGMSLMEGRNFSRLSPWLGDFENVVMLWAGGHYSHPNATLTPKKNEKPKPMPGQKPVNQKFVIELGMRWSFYLPKNYGLYMEAMYQFPTSANEDLKSWNYFVGGVTVAVQ